jgi:hypothetical protein
MKHFGLLFLGLVIAIQLSAQQTYAQRFTVNLHQPNAQQSSEEPTATIPPNNTAPTTTPAPTAAPTASVPTATPAPAQQSSATQTINKVQPTPTPEFVSPLASYVVTPTPKPKAVAGTTTKKTPSKQVAQLIAAPLAIAKTVMPNSYYDEEGLDPKTTNNLLLFAGSSVLLGSLLLAWPSLLELKNRILASFHREDKIVYLHSGKGLLKA